MRELDNNTASADDEGTIWFDENGAEEAVVKLLDSLEEDGLLHKGEEQASSFLDLGTGNGHMLFTLREGEDEDGEGKWEGPMVGVDYSPASVELARKIGEQRGLEPAVRFEEWDLLGAEPGDWLESGFDVVLDKGTFDAISLMPQTEGQEHSCETYRRKVEPLIKKGGLLVLTSCNWTKEELFSWFTPEGGNKALEYFAEAKYPSYTFGGQTGQSIVTVAFRRK